MIANPTRTPVPGRRAVVAGPVVAAATLIAALVVTRAAGVPLRDPGHVSVTRLGIAVALVAVLALADAVVRGARRTGRLVPSGASLRAVWRERWPARRAAAVAVALVSFFVTYMAYRNLKSVVPLVRPGDLFDGPLQSVDRSLFGGSPPGAVLHSALGTSVATPVLSVVYLLFFSFIPVALAGALVLLPSATAGLFVATALALDWALGAGSYYVLPSLGPFHVDPAVFGHLPASGVSAMQHTLLTERAAFLRDPGAAGAAQSVGAFASLHVAIYCTAALATHVLGLSRPWKIAVWTLTGLTVLSTMYFGFHYVLDDVAGLAIAVAALAGAAALTGFDPRAVRRHAPLRAPAPEPEPA